MTDIYPDNKIYPYKIPSGAAIKTAWDLVKKEVLCLSALLPLASASLTSMIAFRTGLYGALGAIPTVAGIFCAVPAAIATMATAVTAAKLLALPVVVGHDETGRPATISAWNLVKTPALCYIASSVALGFGGAALALTGAVPAFALAAPLAVMAATAPILYKRLSIMPASNANRVFKL